MAGIYCRIIVQDGSLQTSLWSRCFESDLYALRLWSWFWFNFYHIGALLTFSLLVISVKVKHLLWSYLLCILWHTCDSSRLISCIQTCLWVRWNSAATFMLPRYCQLFRSVYHYCSCLFAGVLFIPWIPVYFQAIGCCLVVIKRSPSMKVLLFWRRTEFRH